MSSRFSETFKRIEENKKNLELLPTGFKMIDAYIDGGFLRKELVVLGGSTASGKSLVGGEMFYNIASKGFHSAYFSLEISNEMLVSRLIGGKSQIKPSKILIVELEGEEKKKVLDTKARLSVYEEFMTFYDDLYRLDQIEKEIRVNKYEFVVVDFIQNVMANKRDEYERMSFVALSLQKLAKEMNCCILTLSQLSNTMAREKKTDIVEYKGSGSIGMVADLGFFIEKTDAPGTFRIRLRKNRRGVSGEVFGFMIQTPGGGLTEV